MDKIDIQKDLIPYTFDIQLSNFGEDKTYTCKINYNNFYDFFTFDIADSDGDIINGVKIMYGVPLFAKYSATRLPDQVFLALDPKDNEVKITWDNFNDSVILFVLEPEVFV